MIPSIHRGNYLPIGKSPSFPKRVRGLFPMEVSVPISNLYPIESIIGANFLEFHSFVEKEHAVVRFEKGKRELFIVEPDESAPDGILIRVEHKWKNALTMEGLPSFMAILPMNWRPEMFYQR